jgi:hypothetical protein
MTQAPRLEEAKAGEARVVASVGRDGYVTELLVRGARPAVDVGCACRVSRVEPVDPRETVRLHLWRYRLCFAHGRALWDQGGALRRELPVAVPA